MMLKLKAYQERTLAALRTYLDAARIDGPDRAFASFLLQEENPDKRPYKAIEGLEGMPYVCLRLPTGGGKTILASYAIDVAAKSYLEQDFPVVLWLVPTNAIRRQTLDALKKPGHAYRAAIDDAFEGRVAVFDIGEVDRIRPQDINEKVCLIVGTLATLRVDKTEGRKIYAHNENFESHFSRVSQATPGLERIEEGTDQGKIKFSFANLLHLHQPLVIMDEAHNARTPLTFEVLQRISPACIIEFTATPDRSAKSGSNVLVNVSASELKAEEMIKLPIILTEHANWQHAIRDAILTRRKLEENCGKETRFIRPIALIQAENKNREANVEVIRRHLIETEKIEPEKIAVATGEQRELDGIDLFDPNCRIEYIITVEALKEGWDCSFAYVFCSVANIQSGKDVEQILGRVLRMPYAQKRKHDDLNRAYAHVSSPSFAHAALALHDHLVAMGFDEVEANTFIKPKQESFLLESELPLFAGRHIDPLKLILDEAPDPTVLNTLDQETVKVTRQESGQVVLTVNAEITDEIEERLVEAVPENKRDEIRKVIQTHRRYQRPLSPAERGEKFIVPRLCVEVQGELELADKEIFLDHAGWNLLDYPIDLIPDTYPLKEDTKTFEFDIKDKRLIWHAIDTTAQLDLNHVQTRWTDLQLVRWLDREAHQPDVRQEVMLEFIRRCVSSLTTKHKLDLSALVRNRFTLAKVLLEKIKGYRQQACERGYQEALFGPSAAVETSYQFAFTFDADHYPANRWYRGNYQFQKHFYPAVGDLAASGEEFDCAQALDRMPQVKYWVKNLVKSEYAFWLPTSTDRFYPDFVAELKDGRTFVVEYKGEAYVTNDDSKEKRNLGELWEEKSGGKGVFLMVEKRDAQGRDMYRQMADKIG
jgi:type III restriction enzyme